MSEKKGFTLVELLVVIAIIALLMSILMPALNRVKKQAKSAAGKMNLRQWSLIWKIYCDENDDKFCNAESSGWQRGKWIKPLRSRWNTKSDILRCPMAVKPPIGTVINNRHGGPFNTYEMGGGDPKYKETRVSYGFNCWMYSPLPGQTAIQQRPTAWNWKTPTVRGRDNVPVIGDSMWRGGGPISGDPAELANGMTNQHRSYPPNKSPEDVDEWSVSKARGEMKHFCIPRHNKGINMLFLDWHVKEVGLKELWTLKWHKNYNTAGPWTTAGGVQPRDWPEWMRGLKDY